MNKDRASLIRLRLTAEGRDGLYEILHELTNLTLGKRFVLRELHAVGGQSILWLTDDLLEPDHSKLTRLALLPYHRPAYIKDADIRRSRQRIEREAKLLGQFEHSPLPRFCGLFYDRNPLQPSERGPEITEVEPYLVMEFIRGPSVAEWTPLLHAAALSIQRQMTLSVLAMTIAHSAVRLCRILHDQGYLYTDLNPRNLISARADDWPIRVVDAGSIISTSPTPDMDIPFSWAYVPPDYYEAYDAGRKPWPTQDFVMYTLGKTLWQVLTNRQPMPGEHPDLQNTTLLAYPKPLVELVKGLVLGHYESFEQLQGAVPGMEHLRAAFPDLDTMRQEGKPLRGEDAQFMPAFPSRAGAKSSLSTLLDKIRIRSKGT